MVNALMQSFTESERCCLQERLLSLLAARARYATQGDSASLSIEYAQALLDGIVYALQVHLRCHALPVHTLLSQPLPALYDDALCTLQALLERARALYLHACATAPVFANRALHDTLRGIEGFLGRYDYRLFPQDSHCTLDYPLCLPQDAALQGVERILAYLQAFCMENAFLQHFSTDALNKLLNAACPDAQNMIFNLYECAAAQAMGCVIAQGDLRTLTLDAAQRTTLQRLAILDLPALRTRMQAASQQCAAQLHLASPDEQLYLQRAADALCFRLHAALRHGAAQHIFL